MPVLSAVRHWAFINTTRTTMPTPARKPATKRTKAVAAVPEDPTTSEGVAQIIRTESIDLTPSVNRIMNAGLHEAACFRAITLFRDSLGVPGDPNRYPVNAIEAGRLVKEVASSK
jgi:hypothetical protein